VQIDQYVGTVLFCPLETSHSTPTPLLIEGHLFFETTFFSLKDIHTIISSKIYSKRGGGGTDNKINGPLWRLQDTKCDTIIDTCGCRVNLLYTGKIMGILFSK